MAFEICRRDSDKDIVLVPQKARLQRCMDEKGSKRQFIKRPLVRVTSPSRFVDQLARAHA
jgi:hypothetical protein